MKVKYILGALFLISILSLNYGVKSSLTINTDPSGATIYVNGKNIGASPQTVIEDINQSITLNIKAVLNGYQEASTTETLNPGESKTITLNLVSLKKIEAEQAIQSTESYLNDLKDEYSDNNYRTELNKAYDLLNIAQNYYNNGDYDNAILYCNKAKSLGDEIYDSWSKIEDLKDTISKLKDGLSKNGEPYSNYVSNSVISQYESDLNNIISNFNSGDYSGAKEDAKEKSKSIENLISTINSYEDVLKDVDEINSQISDSDLGLHPNIKNRDDINSLIKSIKNSLYDGDYNLANDYIGKLSSKIYEVKSKAINAKNRIKEVLDNINKAKYDYTNIDKGDAKDKFNLAIESIVSAKSEYNNNNFESSKNYAENAQNRLIKAINWYISRKNEVMSYLNKVQQYYNKLANLGVVIPTIIKDTLNKGKYKCSIGYFDEGKNYGEKAENELKILENKWRKANESIESVQLYIKTLETNNPDIVLDKSKNTLMNIINKEYKKGKYDKIPEECDELKKKITERKKEYDEAKISLKRLYDKLKLLNSSWNITNAMKKYNEIKKDYYLKGYYISSKEQSDDYLNKINLAEKSINEAENYIETHDIIIILKSVEWPVNYSQEINLLQKSKKEFNMSNYVLSKKLADKAKKSAVEKYYTILYGNSTKGIVWTIIIISLLTAVVITIKGYSSIRGVIEKKKNSIKEDYEVAEDDDSK